MKEWKNTGNPQKALMGPTMPCVEPDLSRQRGFTAFTKVYGTSRPSATTTSRCPNCMKQDEPILFQSPFWKIFLSFYAEHLRKDETYIFRIIWSTVRRF